MRSLVQGPGHADLLRCCSVTERDGVNGLAVVGGRTCLAPRAGDREEGHERNASVSADPDEVIVFRTAGVDRIPVLYADDRCDGPSLIEMIEADAGQAEVPDESGIAELRESAETLGDRVLAGPSHDPEIHHVEVVAAEPAQILLDLAAQLSWGGRLVEAGRGINARSHLGGDDQVLRVRRERFPDQLGGIASGAGPDVQSA